MTRILTLLLALWAGVPALASSDSNDASDADWHSQREAAAEDNFQTIMMKNAVQQDFAQGGAAMAPAADPAPEPNLPPRSIDMEIPPAGGNPASVTVDLARWEAARRALAAAQEASRETPPPMVVLGASSYAGRDIGGALQLRLDLQVTLHGDDLWKTVPLVGEEVVVVAAQAGGRAVPLSTESGYHVWITQETGEVTLSLDLLVPARGRKGSLEYEFLAPRTPVTRFQADFATPGLEPRLRGAVQAEAAPIDGGQGTRLQALLAPTSRVHLVGYKDQGEDEGRQARVYAESLNLLSIDEDRQELFTVLRYNILYAGQKEFSVALPAGFSVVSADGEGAFRYTLEQGADGAQILKGETEYPIRNSYEISLRLRRDEPGNGEPFALALPRCMGVEREYGWLAVEVTGALQLEEKGRDAAALAVDVRQLPWEMVQSAVSPILRAWRTHSAEATVQLQVTRLPDVEPQSASVDRVEADTVVSAEGRRLTDVRITLRNRLRHSLRVVLPAGAELRSSLLDGEPVKPSKAADGALLFPLKRSEDLGAGLRPFTVQLVVEEAGSPVRILGRQGLSLPAVELPVSSLSWTVWLPAANSYTALESDVEAQVATGAGNWWQPLNLAVGFQGVLGLEGQDGTGAFFGGNAGEATGETGAMPVRIELPKTGTALTLSRYWVEGAQPVTARTWHVRSWLAAPAALAAFLGLFFALGAVGRRQLSSPLRGQALLGPALGLAALGALLAATGGGGLVLLAALLAGGRLATERGQHRRILPGLKAWWATPAEPEQSAWKQRRVLSRLGLVGAGLFAGFLVFIAAVRWLDLLGSPL